MWGMKQGKKGLPYIVSNKYHRRHQKIIPALEGAYYWNGNNYIVCNGQRASKLGRRLARTIKTELVVSHV